MSKPMTHTQFVALLDKWSIPHEDNSRGGVKWYNHNRNSKGEWSDLNGIGNHHTGAADNTAGAGVLWNGYAALPGPLCHGGIRQNGAVLLNGWGRANHFGLGDSDVLKHVKNEDYTGTLKPRKANVDGNSHFYGFEWMYDGLHEPSEKYPKLYSTAVLLNAAICTFHGWTERSSIGHGEWQPGKWDPGHSKGKLFDCAKFRNHIQQAIHEGPPKKLPETYTVIKNDTLYKIATKKLGKGSRYKEIADLNHIDVNAILNVGQKLKLPKK